MKSTLVVIPHYGPDALLADLLGSIGIDLPASGLLPQTTLLQSEHAGGDCVIAVINNNSVNRGFTAACNMGLRLLPGRFAYGWILNNDTHFDSPGQFLEGLEVMQSLAEQKDWDLVSQQVRHARNTDEIVFGGALSCFPVGRHKSGLCSRGDWQLPTEENWLSFCSVLIREEVLARIGLLDEGLFNYFSDSDYSLRIRKAGRRIGYAGANSYCYHRTGQSAHPDAQQERILRGDYRNFWQKWLAGPEHRCYLELTQSIRRAGSRLYPAAALGEAAGEFPPLQDWLSTLPPELELGLEDILDHFQHQVPPLPFTILCNVTRHLQTQGAR